MPQRTSTRRQRSSTRSSSSRNSTRRTSKPKKEEVYTLDESEIKSLIHKTLSKKMKSLESDLFNVIMEEAR